ncbi:MAG: phosphoglycerate kinase [Flavobacteriaceae bacterium]|nr:phosphoglycerate kinase [Flavobacteriaceae bacterium]
MKTLNDFDFNGKTALIRVDFNVPLDDEQKVTDTTRIEAAKPTIMQVLNQGGSCVLMSHLGRPKNRDQKLSLEHIVSTAEQILGVKVLFVSDCIGEKPLQALAQLPKNSVLLLENLRFYTEEEQGDTSFAQSLAELGDIYVNDAFGTAHRAHASTAIIADYFKGKSCFGTLLASEITNVNRVMLNGESPVTAIIGGAKVSSKITIIERILDAVDHLIIGGGMAFTFIKAQGGSIGTSLVEDDKQELALNILELASAKGVEVHLPIDTVITQEFSNDSETDVAMIHEIPDGWMGLDAGPETRQKFSEVIHQSKTLLFNGPVGVFEMPTFAEGTIALCEAIALATKNGAFSLVGGGDSVAAVKQFNYDDQVSYVSTGGGAMLEMLEGKTLPGIVAVLNA